jgi:hypothetical protein
MEVGEIGKGERGGENQSPARSSDVLARWMAAILGAWPLFSVGVSRSGALAINSTNPTAVSDLLTPPKRV